MRLSMCWSKTWILLDIVIMGAPNVVGILRLWDTLKNYFVHTPIRMANGECYKKRNGIASGSYFTQLVGSVANAILMNYVSIKLCNK